MAPLVAGALRASSFRGSVAPFQRCAQPVRARCLAQPIVAKRICELTGAKRNKANNVSFSNKKSRKFQEVNLQEKKVYFEAGKRWVKVKVSAQALRTIKKNGLESVAAKAGVDLFSLKYIDVSPARLEWKAANPAKPPMAKNPRKMKNPEKIAASKKGRRVAEYCVGKILYTRAEE